MAQTHSLAWEFPYAVGAAIKKKERKTKAEPYVLQKYIKVYQQIFNKCIRTIFGGTEVPACPALAGASYNKLHETGPKVTSLLPDKFPILSFHSKVRIIVIKLLFAS